MVIVCDHAPPCGCAPLSPIIKKVGKLCNGEKGTNVAGRIVLKLFIGAPLSYRPL